MLGNEIFKICRSCKRYMQYNQHYHCFQCDCGKCYNGALEEIRPLKEWKDEYDEELRDEY